MVNLRVRSVILAGVLFGLVYWLRPQRQRAAIIFPPAIDQRGLCSFSGMSMEALDRVQIALKTGIGEPEDKIKSILSGFGACIPNLIIYSDVEQTIEVGSQQYKTVDALERLPEDYLEEDDDVAEVYADQKKAFAEDRKPEQSSGGWKLDKHKFLPMMERTFARRPDANWYFFIEADTYLSLNSMLHFLDRVSSNDKLYMGSPAPGSHETFFAYGGCGFLVSRALMSELMSVQDGENVDHQVPSTRYVDFVRDEDCGDCALGKIMKNITHTTISGYWPTFQSTSVHQNKFVKKYWCSPALTLHRTQPETVVALSQWEERRRRNNTGPLLYADLFDFVYDHYGLAAGVKSDWDNTDHGDGGGVSSPKASAAVHESFQACQNGCRAKKGCMQCQYFNQTCSYVDHLVIGAAQGHDTDAEDQRYHSWWDLEKIENWKTTLACRQPAWLKPSTKRHDW